MSYISIKEAQDGMTPDSVTGNVANYLVDTMCAFMVNVHIDLTTGARTAEVIEFNKEIDGWTSTPVAYSEIENFIPTLLVIR